MLGAGQRAEEAEKMKLRPYQESSKDALREGIRSGHVRQVLCASTGAGKSIVMLSMIQNAVEKGSKVLFICERRILVAQFSMHLDRAGIGHGVMMAGTWRHRPQELVQVASAQTIEKMESLPIFDICFIDEIHACMRKSIINLIKTRPNMKIIGATATPFNPKLAEHFSNIVNVVTMKELIAEGHLVPFRVFMAHEVNTDGVKLVAGEFKADDLEGRARQITGDVVSDYIRIANEIHGEQRKAICFSCGVAHGAELAQKFNEAGVNAVQISYKDDDEYKADVLKEFAKPETAIKVLISSDILERGFDQSDIDIVILGKPVKKSFSKFVQMIGRGARPHPDKSFVTIIDHGSNWLRFSEEWESLFHDGVQVLSGAPDAKPKREPTELEKKRAKCGRCGAVWPGNSDICANCGNVRTRRNEVVAVPGEMLELTGAPKKEKYSSEFKEQWYHGLIAHLRATGKNENRAYHLYREKFKVDPAWKKVAGSQLTPAAMDARNYLQRANIAFAKSAKRAA